MVQVTLLPLILVPTVTSGFLYVVHDMGYLLSPLMVQVTSLPLILVPTVTSGFLYVGHDVQHLE